MTELSDSGGLSAGSVTVSLKNSVVSEVTCGVINVNLGI
jgi:hypothetical protein